MSPEHQPLEARVEQLEEEVQNLHQRLDQLASNQPARTPKPTPQPVKPSIPQEESQAWAGSSSLLSRISALCFLMVIALALRTLTDNGIIALQIGSMIGIAYAATLILFGYYRYSQSNPIAPIFSISGAVLIFSIVAEAHFNFESVSIELAYSILALAGIAMGLTSHIHKASLPIIVGTFGMCMAGIAIDYPTPYFPYIALVLWLANFLGYFATRLKRCSWLRWILLGATYFMLLIWGMKLGIKLLPGENMASPLAPNWFIPILVLFFISYIAISILGIVRVGEERISKFDFLLPTISAASCYHIGLYAKLPPATYGAIFGLLGLIHLGLAYWLSTRKKAEAPGTNSFSLAGATLLALSLPIVLGDELLPLPILSALALLIAFLAPRWNNGGMRVTSYLLQSYATLILATRLADPDDGNFWAALIVTAICGLVSLAHYRFCKQNAVPKGSAFFSKVDKEDHSSVLILLAGLTNGYFMTMVLVYQVLLAFVSDDVSVAFAGMQTVAINGSATVIICLSLFWRNKELRNVAILITIIGGAKVFLVDMLNISGLALVFSVFSFGIAAATESFILSKWHKLEIENPINNDSSSESNGETSSQIKESNLSLAEEE